MCAATDRSGGDGREHLTYITVEVWGRAGAVEASQLPPGTLVLVSGQMKPKKIHDQWTRGVTTRELTRLDHLADQGEYDTEKAG